jgi:F420-0:gamma-glutamyl ligase
LELLQPIGHSKLFADRVKGYIAPAFEPNVGIIITDGKPFYIKIGEFFTAMGVAPSKCLHKPKMTNVYLFTS